jgi:hypothetical protein
VKKFAAVFALILRSVTRLERTGYEIPTRFKSHPQKRQPRRAAVPPASAKTIGCGCGSRSSLATSATINDNETVKPIRAPSAVQRRAVAKRADSSSCGVGTAGIYPDGAAVSSNVWRPAGVA